MSGLRLHYASSNPGKLREFALAAKNAGHTQLTIEALPRLAEIPAPAEDALSFEGNARTKAEYYSRFSPELVVADDSGLEVAALGGEPGVHSARYAGAGASEQANNELLLTRMQGQIDRSARFVCVLALARGGRVLETFRGTVPGKLLQQLRGNSGFGYDALFVPCTASGQVLTRSFGELTAEEKFALSHRGKALRALMDRLQRGDTP